MARVNDHPDAMLRLTGLIQQSGVRRFQLLFSEAVVYDEALQSWVQKEKRAVRTISKNAVTERIDVAPLGLISVVGHFDLNQTTVKGPSWVQTSAALQAQLTAEGNSATAEIFSEERNQSHARPRSGGGGAPLSAAPATIKKLCTTHTIQDGCGYDVRQRTVTTTTSR